METLYSADPGIAYIVNSPDSPVPTPPAPRSASAISWAAIIGGAMVVAASTLLLVTLGAGFGLAAISPWPGAGASVTGFAVSAGIWLIMVQWVSSGLGGYVTGRLRTRWLGTHTHEVFFRDTAHGFLTWATASIIVATLLGMAASSAIGTGTSAAATVAVTAPALAMQAHTYDVDMLMRGEKPELAASRRDAHAEASRIVAHGLVAQGLGGTAAADRLYLSQLIATRTGIAPAEAQKRVDDLAEREKAMVAAAKLTADAARKYATAAAIFTALSMLIGAFIACAAAALGGSQRDEHA